MIKTKLMNIYGKNKPHYYNGFRIVIEDKEMKVIKKCL